MKWCGMDKVKNAESLSLTGLAEALRCCCTNSGDGGGCIRCPMERQHGGDCSETIMRLAAQKLLELANATEGACQREINEMVRLAGECNTAMEQGRGADSDGLFAQILEHQTRLEELGREAVIRAMPQKWHGWRIDGIEVDGTGVYSGPEESEGAGHG